MGSGLEEVHLKEDSEPEKAVEGVNSRVERK
jgi:hypothetical protein